MTCTEQDRATPARAESERGVSAHACIPAVNAQLFSLRKDRRCEGSACSRLESFTRLYSGLVPSLQGPPHTEYGAWSTVDRQAWNTGRGLSSPFFLNAYGVCTAEYGAFTFEVRVARQTGEITSCARAGSHTYPGGRITQEWASPFAMLWTTAEALPFCL